MKERPMLYTGAMVRAVLADAKTMTRRVMKVQPSEGSTVTVERYEPAVVSRSGELVPGPEVFGAHWGDGEFGIVCPYGQPGDRLWVREAFQIMHRGDDWDIPIYRADDIAGHINGGWRPSIHMPRAACRLVLEITDIRAERLQDITFADAQAEGWPPMVDGKPNPYDPITWFKLLWVELYGAGSWDANPYVWRISFKKVEA
ncbi:hypothetical protein [Chromobacterium haemolyticum]|uniref:hypothetical protein n=1 Tax=Chromobacterium haemolyticum TaxID=394935 RepID=UPI00244C0409|nr:hypothetical protein [Chromobacterium haemolyticum]MDH0340651.1 hypothetical protein [Chromobacterium haemolyticum]